MVFKIKEHNNLYNNLLFLSRNIFFYKELSLSDTFQTRISLMLFHFSIVLIIFKKKKKNFDQNSYDHFFHNIEYNLRESGLGDVTVNKNMKDLNKTLYDILLKLDLKINDDIQFQINSNLVLKYFNSFNDEKNSKFINFADYFNNFYKFCFELRLDNMIQDIKLYKY